MRKRKLTLQDWAHIPTVEVKSDGRPSLKKFQAEEAKRTQEKLTVRLRAIEEPLKQEAREITREVKAFFSLDLKEMAGFPITAAPTDYGDFQTRSGPRDELKEGAIYRMFKSGLASRGCLLTMDGWNRIGSYVSALAEHGADVRLDTWQKSLDRLVSLGCFHSGEITGYQPPAKQVTQPIEQRSAKPSLENLSTENREQRAQCLRIVSQEWGQEVRDFYTRWADSMKTNWNVDVLDETFARRVGDYFVKFNKDPLRHKSYDEFRLIANRNGWLPGDGDYRTDSEKLSDLIEINDTTDRDVRLEIGRRHREILENSPPLPLHK
jgi:hypothetical protein